MSLPTKKFGNINIKIGGGAKIRATNTIIGASQVNLGSSRDNRQPTNIEYGDVNVEIADNADIETESLIAGAGEVNIAPAGSFLSIFNGDQTSAELFKTFGVRVDLPFNADKKNQEHIKEFMKNDPPQILTLVKSICLVLTNNSLGTGFLATVPDHDGVVLFSAGHNFMPTEASESSEDFWNVLKDITFNFNCLDGNPHGTGVTKIKYADLMHYDPKVIIAYKGIILSITAGEDPESKETDPEHDYFAMVLNKAAKDKIVAKHNLEFLSCPDDWNVQMDHPRINDGEPLFYSGYPVTKTESKGDALRFSYGNCHKVGSKIKISYDMDTMGGASGAPVLNSKYKAVAIHTKKDKKKKLNFGNVLKSVYEELKKDNLLSS